MRRFIILVSLAFACALPARAAESGLAGSGLAGSGLAAPDLFAAFDARALDGAERRLLLGALAASGDYDGPIDGAWGAAGQRGIESYAAREFEDAPLNLHAATLIIGFTDEIARDGWDLAYLAEADLSFALPFALVKAADEADGPGWRTRDDGIAIRTARQTDATAVAWHRAVAAAHDRPGAARTLRRTDLMITIAETADGTRVYQRSDYLDGGWSTIRVLSAPGQLHRARLIAASIAPGEPAPWDLPAGGLLAELVARTFARLAEARPTPVAAPRPAEIEAAETGTDVVEEMVSTGSGFYLGPRLLVTAAHVVQGCDRLALADGTALELLAADGDLDIAALRTAAPAPAWLRLAPAGEIRLGQRVNALGYPYFGLSGTSLNITGGNVSALAGMDDDARFLSISAPVQPGNSGGPLLDREGAVAGVVVARLSDGYISETTGSLPQNVNFALRDAELAVFLRGNGLFPSDRGLPAFDMDDGAPSEIADIVVPIVCD
ncbi:serine protease [uncultured Amaricoccus sp.]|uniref:S1C family serine protease n=2 Tax=Amaricoccus TaxID=56999 RepID=UPI002607AC26|nr:serine protease [uncultured Amaricoccus sp.]